MQNYFVCFFLVIVCVPFSLELDRYACKPPDNVDCTQNEIQCGIGEQMDIKSAFHVFVNTYAACSAINCPIQEWHECGSDRSICRVKLSAADRLQLNDQCNGNMYCDLRSPILNSTYCNKTTTRTVCFNGTSYQQNGYFILYDCQTVFSTISPKQPNVKSTTPEVNKVSARTSLLGNILFTSSNPPVISTGQSDNEASRPDRGTSDTSVIIGSVVGSLLLMVLVIIIVIVVIRRRKSDVARTTGVSNPGYETPTLRTYTRENSQFTTDGYNHLHGAQDNNSHNVNDNYNHLMANAEDTRIRPNGDYTNLYDNNVGGVRHGVTIVNDSFDISDNHTDQQ